MKDIMTDCSMTETRAIATEKWREYIAASKTYKNPIYADLQKVYNQVRNGQKVVDIGKVIAKGGVHPNFHPKLAIAKATTKTIQCIYRSNGDVSFLNRELDWRSKSYSDDIFLKACLPLIPTQHLPKISWGNGHDDKLQLKAPIPICPPRLLPKNLTEDYYILWEVDEWKMVPPTDPYLLRRITKNMFVVLAAWDLTELEKACMAGKMY